MSYRRKLRPKRGRKKRGEADIAQAVVAHVYGVPVDELRAGTRCGPRAAFARQVAMYLAHVTYGLSLSEIGFAFGRDRTTASHACHRIEDLRDDPCLDKRLTRLEDMLRDAARFGAAQ